MSHRRNQTPSQNDLDALFDKAFESPDMTQDILSRVGDRRRFLSPRMRRIVREGRLVALTALLLGLLGITVLQRRSPELMIPVSGPSYVSDVVDSSRTASVTAFDTLSDVVHTARRIVPGVDRQPARGSERRVVVSGRCTIVCDRVADVSDDTDFFDDTDFSDDTETIAVSVEIELGGSCDSEARQGLSAENIVTPLGYVPSSSVGVMSGSNPFVLPSCLTDQRLKPEILPTNLFGTPTGVLDGRR